jgi:hypothetical protein
MCRSCAVEDGYCFCGTHRQPLPDGQHCGCESGDHCPFCGHSSTGGPSIPAYDGGGEDQGGEAPVWNDYGIYGTGDEAQSFEDEGQE